MCVVATGLSGGGGVAIVVCRGLDVDPGSEGPPSIQKPAGACYCVNKLKLPSPKLARLQSQIFERSAVLGQAKI